ncbi:MAG: PadR family transcriptional regulator [Coriobacteriia bacterium]|nr:PadR family transcriptional regulator [Coriobacteriia bacterium]
MSVRHGLLAILDTGPRHGYQLKLELEARTGHTWVVNIGQVYATLARLERDGLVERLGHSDDPQIDYRITESGSHEVRKWFDTPVARRELPRDELTVKLMLSYGTGCDSQRVIQIQRTAVMGTLQEFTRLKSQANAGAELAWLATLDHMILQTEAEARWLDLVEARIAAAGPATTAARIAAPEIDSEPTSRATTSRVSQ